MRGYMITLEQADQYFIHVYNRNVVFEKGEDVYLYDDKGKKYLDFAAGIAVSALGYSNHKYKNTLKEQINKLIHTSNLFYNQPAILAGEKFIKASGLDKVFFTNSGTEAIEGSLKLVRKYAYLKNPDSKGHIVAMNHSFHGRSMGALSVTGTKKYREPFEPLIGNVSFAEFNDFETVKAQITEDTCAILLEPIQGEGGIYPAEKEFLKQVRHLCDEKDIVLIFDEIQCGMGRTGTMFAYQQYEVKPDVIVSAKALGGGVPVGAFAAINKIADAFVPGDHGTTYGSNPLVMSAVSCVFDIFEEEQILKNVQQTADYLEEKLNTLCEKYPVIKERRGLGLMQGLEFEIPVAGIIKEALQKGVIIIAAGTNTIRFVPPLIIEKQHVDELCDILESILRVCLKTACV